MSKILLVIGILIVAVVATVLIVDFKMTMSNGIGWVWQDRHGDAVKEFIKEENGCVYFIDVYDSEMKACGNYVIKKY